MLMQHCHAILARVPGWTRAALVIWLLAASRLDRDVPQLVAMLDKVSPDLMVYSPENAPEQDPESGL